MPYDPLQYNNPMFGNQQVSETLRPAPVFPTLPDFSAPVDAIPGYTRGTVADSTPATATQPINLYAPPVIATSTLPVSTVPKATVGSTNPVNTNGVTPMTSGTWTSPTGAVIDIATGQVITPAPAATMTPPPATGSVAALGMAPALTADQQYLQDYYAKQKTLGETPVDQNQIQKDTLARYQAQIDAQNAHYADLINQSRIVNAPAYQARLDQNRIQQIQHGFGGTGAGAAQTTDISSANAKEQAIAEARIEAERQNAINAIMGKVDTNAQTDYAAKLAAQKGGTDSYIAHLNEAPARAKAAISDAVKNFISSKIDINTASPEELTSWANKLGTTVQGLKAEYNTQKKTADAAQLKTTQEAQKVADEHAKSVADVASIIQKSSEFGKISATKQAELKQQGIKNANDFQLAKEKAGATDLYKFDKATETSLYGSGETASSIKQLQADIAKSGPQAVYDYGTGLSDKTRELLKTTFNL